ncbi:uncharacterized protein [Prorops nasuta]|uniref:uncharacterized protein n=1 Tax=Prorops nasuta TaxID=863751 RepID=UPI0034CFA48B
MEDIKTVIRLIDRHSYMAIIDLKDAYFSIPVEETSRKYLRFRFRKKLYEFNCMPFGLSTAPYTFTKLMKPVIENLRSKGFVFVVYLDDFLLLGGTKRECEQNVKETKQLLEKLEYIGILVAACPAVRLGMLYIKSLEREKFIALTKSKGNYDEKMTISDNLLPDLNWWGKNILTCINPIRVDNFSMEIFSDASLTGWGAVCGKEKAHGFWSFQERKEHINMLELIAVFHGLKCFAKDKLGHDILLRVDNTTAISYINKMGSIQYLELSTLAKKIWQWCEARQIWIFASYIKSKDNKEADEQSRLTQPETEWELGSWTFKEIENNFGNFDIDLFASNTNSKCKKFISWRRDPEARAIDAFTGTSPAKEIPFPGCREVIRQAFELRKVPPDSIPVIIASLSDGTIKQYQKPLRLWWEFCQEINTSPFVPIVKEILRFLTRELTKIKTVGTLNSYRSALSLIVGNEIGLDPTIRRFFRGVAMLRPQTAKYDEIWDPEMVLKHLRTLWPHEEISFECLTKKLATLLALITAQRVQTLAKIKLSNIQITESGIRIKIPDRIKTSRQGRPQPLLEIPFFKDQPRLCAASVLSRYIEETKLKRPKDEENLLITYRKPYKAAKTQTIRRWIKEVLKSSGIDVNTFGSHSTRHAVTSAAFKRNVDIETIRKTAGWTSKSKRGIEQVPVLGQTETRELLSPLHRLASFKHSARLIDEKVEEHIRPIYEELSNDDLMTRCLGGHTQNSNESFNSTVWRITPKHLNSGQKIVEIAAYMAARMFNEGYSAVLHTMQLLNLKIGQQCKMFADNVDIQRIERERRRSSLSSKETRTVRRLEQLQQNEFHEEAEGLLYGAGIAD